MFHRSVKNCFDWRDFAYYQRYAYAGHPGYSHRRRRRRADNSDDLAMHSRRHRGGGGGFGVRRPLRYLSYQLDLDEEQTRRVAAVLERLKLDREQARLDRARTTVQIADLVKGGEAATEDYKRALAPRLTAGERMQSAVAAAVTELVEILDAEQRDQFAYLLSSGSFEL